MDPEDFPRCNALNDQLTAEINASYAAVINWAGNLRNTNRQIGTSGPGYQRALYILEGLAYAATEILKAEPARMPHHPAALRADADIVAMCRAMADDVEEYYQAWPQGLIEPDGTP